MDPPKLGAQYNNNGWFIILHDRPMLMSNIYYVKGLLIYHIINTILQLNSTCFFRNGRH